MTKVNFERNHDCIAFTPAALGHSMENKYGDRTGFVFILAWLIWSIELECTYE